MLTTHYLRAELKNILDYWYSKVFYAAEDRFYGRVDERDHPEIGAPMGSVMYARILWTCAAVYRVIPDLRYLQMAAVAYRWLNVGFNDPVNGGIYWLISANGAPVVDKKQIYAQAFTLYSFAEYYRINPEQQILDKAIALYELIEQHSFDPMFGGYFEAFARNWSAARDMRLSPKDLNYQKTMNTHLHIMEAYVNLYRVWPDVQLAGKINQLINLFGKHIVHASDKHLGLFFDEQWTPKSATVSYGHDVEASWLLCEAAEVLGNTGEIYDVRQLAIAMVEAAKQGFDNNGGLNYEYEPRERRLIAEKHWWVQAESVVGLLNAWQITGDHQYYAAFQKNWDYIITHVIDRQNGEWFWGIGADGKIMPGQDKAGVWKCPYHNSRCLLQMLDRLANRPKK